MARIDGEWLQRGETRRIFAALTAQGAQARFVGGCVRDALMGLTVKDIDIAVAATPEENLAALQHAGVQAIPTGIDHGVISAVIGDHIFEIASLRRDVSGDGRRAVVAYTDDWLEDARRRDLTINALYADIDGRVYDPLGAGARDLADGRIAFIGDPADRIREDYLRILRFFRFSARYGDGMIDSEALVACAGLAPGLDRVSRERVGAEMFKLLSAPDPSLALRLMGETGVLRAAAPFADAAAPMAALVAAERRLALTPSSLRRLALLAGDAKLDAIANSLRMSKQDARALERRLGRDVIESPADARRAGYRRGAAAARDLLALQAARSGAAPTMRLLPAIDEGANMKMPVQSRDLLAAGMVSGPELGAALAKAERAWLDSDFLLDKSTLLYEALGPHAA